MVAARLAQSVERETLNLKVAGSTPASGSIPDASQFTGNATILFLAIFGCVPLQILSRVLCIQIVALWSMFNPLEYIGNKPATIHELLTVLTMNQRHSTHYKNPIFIITGTVSIPMWEGHELRPLIILPGLLSVKRL
ncbi:hypothetical protein F4782DRAFT_19143 [Xylaria castorea]|nr:hypothetical protein F4782DRAFT_19143 [Xylaria castorea]